MNKYILLIILCFLAKSALSQQEESYFPLAVGNSWEYYISDAIISSYTENVSIISKVQKPNGKYYYVHLSTIQNRNTVDSTITFYRTDDSNNIYLYSEKYKKEFISDKLYSKIGEIWQTFRFGFHPDTNYSRITGTIVFDSIGNIGNNQFKKIKGIRYYDGGFCISQIQFVQGIGIYSQWFEAYTRVELVKYHLITSSAPELKREYPVKQYLLYDNYPNPFNPSTNIKILLNSNIYVYLMIYDLFGREIKLLYSGQLNKGEHIFAWNGKNDNNNTVSSGVYFYKINILDVNGNTINSENRKMILVR
jgi:hypothetical protein